MKRPLFLLALVLMTAGEIMIMVMTLTACGNKQQGSKDENDELNTELDEVTGGLRTPRRVQDPPTIL